MNGPLLRPLTIGAAAVREEGRRIDATSHPWPTYGSHGSVNSCRHHARIPLAHHPLPGLTSVRTFAAVRVPTRCSWRPNISEVTANKCGSGAAQYVCGWIWGFFFPPSRFYFSACVNGAAGFPFTRSQVMFQLIGCADTQVTHKHAVAGVSLQTEQTRCRSLTSKPPRCRVYCPNLYPSIHLLLSKCLSQQGYALGCRFQGAHQQFLTPRGNFRTLRGGFGPPGESPKPY